MNNLIEMLSMNETEIEDIRILKNKMRPLYLYGNGSTAKTMLKTIKNYDIVIDGIIVSDSYYKEETFEGYNVSPLSYFDKECVSIDIIAAYNWGEFTEVTKYLNTCNFVNRVFIWKGNEYFYLGFPMYNKVKCMDWYSSNAKYRGITKDFIIKSFEELKKTFDWLEDDLSKETMLTYLKGHVNMLSMPMAKIYNKDQYFQDDLFSLSDNEIFLDCGAYTGDSIEPFIRKTKGKYSKIYAMEPDQRVLPELRKNIEKYSNIKIIEKGAYDKEGFLEFSEDNSCGVIVDESNNKFIHKTKINTCKIDSVIEDQNVTFIKMDIEGAELKALYGAENTIKKNSPILAICVYHKKDDLIDIPAYIKKLNPTYRFYLRVHLPYASELVLYAIPTIK